MKQRPAHFHGVLEVAVAREGRPGRSRAGEPLGGWGSFKKLSLTYWATSWWDASRVGKRSSSSPEAGLFPPLSPTPTGGMCSKNRLPTPSGVERRVDLGKLLTQERALSPHGFPGQEQRRELLPVAVRRV